MFSGCEPGIMTYKLGLRFGIFIVTAITVGRLIVVTFNSSVNYFKLLKLNMHKNGKRKRL
jgi:hypothetical protein